MSIYGYCRVSTAEQVGGSSLEEQARKIEGIAMIHGRSVAEVFTDRGISGSTPLRSRPEGARLVGVLAPGDVVIVAKMDRIFRNAADALTTAQTFKNSGVDLIVADMGTEPVTQSGASKMFFGMLALMAEFERDRIRERQADGIKAKKARNGYIGGTRPFGFRVVGKGPEATIEPVQSEQAAIVRIKSLKASGMSLRAIAATICADGVQISHVGVKKVLARPVG